jgi:hypothetical protein
MTGMIHLMNDHELNAYGEFQGNIFELLKRDDFRAKNVMRPLFHIHAHLLRDLQLAHDRPIGEPDDWMNRWKELMRDMARRYNLNDAVLSEAV